MRTYGAPNVTKIRARRYALYPAILRRPPRNITRFGVTTSSDTDPVILRGLRHRGVWKPRNITWSAWRRCWVMTPSYCGVNLEGLFSDPVILRGTVSGSRSRSMRVHTNWIGIGIRHPMSSRESVTFNGVSGLGRSPVGHTYDCWLELSTTYYYTYDYTYPEFYKHKFTVLWLGPWMQCSTTHNVQLMVTISSILWSTNKL